VKPEKEIKNLKIKQKKQTNESIKDTLEKEKMEEKNLKATQDLRTSPLLNPQEKKEAKEFGNSLDSK